MKKKAQRTRTGRRCGHGAFATMTTTAMTAIVKEGARGWCTVPTRWRCKRANTPTAAAAAAATVMMRRRTFLCCLFLSAPSLARSLSPPPKVFRGARGMTRYRCRRVPSRYVTDRPTDRPRRWRRLRQDEYVHAIADDVISASETVMRPRYYDVPLRIPLTDLYTFVRARVYFGNRYAYGIAEFFGRFFFLFTLFFFYVFRILLLRASIARDKTKSEQEKRRSR